MKETFFIVITPIVIFLVAFPALWVGVNAVLSYTGGWALLAKRFRSDHSEKGHEFRFATALFKKKPMPPVTYRGNLFITIGENGIQLSLLFLFRVLSPPLLIPWSEIEGISEQRHLFGIYGVIDIRNCPVRILVPGNAGKYLLDSRSGLPA